MNKKILSTNKRYFGAKDIDLFVNTELTREQNFLKPDKVNNVFDYNLKFIEERNSSSKFCVYGLVESKWGDCNNLKIDIRIGDSSTNIPNPNIPQTTNDVFWIYDFTTNNSAYTWSINSRKLDNSNGNLSKNLYGKNKGSYFFPFQLDLNLITKVNKSIYLTCSNLYDNLFINKEIPFLYFDDEGNLLEYGQETAEILDNGNTLEINNNYPFFYDRHWIRTELEAEGPPYIFFTSDNIVVSEGSNNPDSINNKIIDVNVSLSKPSLTGLEKAKINVVYGTDENLQPYTTVRLPEDVILNFNDLEWTQIGENPLKTFRIQITDDYFVEPVERLTLKITPIIGLYPDPIKSQYCSIYIYDNDIPSKVSFVSPSTQVFEDRQDINPIQIPISLNLDRLLKVPNQYCDIFIDEKESDCESTYGFNNGTGDLYSKTTRINFDQTNLNYNTNLNLLSSRFSDIRRKIVLKLTGFTSNIIPGTVSQTNSLDYTIFVDKQLDNNYVTIHIPHNKNTGLGVVRSTFNKPSYRSNYNTLGLDDKSTVLATYPNSINGYLEPNSAITGLTTSFNLPNTSSIRTLVFEDFFQLEIKNLGSTIVFDNHDYKTNDTLVVNVYSGNSTSASSGQFYYDGEKFILKLPANSNFLTSTITLPNGQMSGVTWGYTKTQYDINIQNNSYNYPSGVTLNDQFYTTNILNKQVFYGQLKPPQRLEYQFSSNFAVDAGNDNYQNIFNLVTRVKNVYSQIEFSPDIATYNSLFDRWTIERGEVISYTGNTSKYTEGELYYNSALIIPNSYLFDRFDTNSTGDQSTESIIFLTNDYVVVENEFTRSGTTTNSQNISYLFPVGAYTVFWATLANRQIPLKAKFENLYVQSGNFNNTVRWYNLLGQQQTVNTDAFMMKTISSSNNGNPALGDFNSIFTWQNANSITKQGAVIEVVNNGYVPVFISGKKVNPNEAVWFSESPVTTSNPSVVYNFVQPINNLILDLPTNSKFVGKKTLNNTKVGIFKFSESNYNISFYNFKIYNSDGTFTNLIQNDSCNFNGVATFNSLYTSLGYVNPIQNEYHLTTRFNNNVLINFQAYVPNCSNNYFLSSASPLWRSPGFQGIEIRGYLATPSTSSAPISIKFVKTSELLTNYGCTIPGLTWYKFY